MTNYLLPDQSTLPADGFLRIKDVLKIIPVGKSTFWAGVKSGRFPKSVKIGPRITAWRVSDIQAFINNFKPE